MNLAELREEIEGELQYGPDTAAWRNKLTRDINRAYLQLCTENRWEFLVKTSTLTVYPKDGYFTFTAETTYGFDTGGSPATVSDWEGQTLVSASESLDSRIVYVDSSNNVIIEDAHGVTLTNTVTDIEIHFDKYRLPDDCADVLSLSNLVDETGKLDYLYRPTEAQWMLLESEEGQRPNTWVPAPSEHVEAPRFAPTLVSANDGSGGLVAGTKYRYCYTFLHKGMESPRSPIAEVTVSAGHDSVDITLPVGDGFSINSLRIYREDADSGVFAKIVDIGASGLTYSDLNILTGKFNEVLYYDRGPYKFIRVYPKPGNVLAASKTTADAGTAHELVYYAKPRPLIHDTDTPEIPTEHHDVLISLVTAQVAARRGDTDLAAYHERKLKRRDGSMSKMRRRYLTRTARDWKRRNITDRRNPRGGRLTITLS